MRLLLPLLLINTLGLSYKSIIQKRNGYSDSYIYRGEDGGRGEDGSIISVMAGEGKQIQEFACRAERDATSLSVRVGKGDAPTTLS